MAVSIGRVRGFAGLLALLAIASGATLAQPFEPRDSSGVFINWESPHVNPVAITPDGTRLLAVNTADNRLEVFSILTGTPIRTASIPVGLDPVTVRARGNNQAWVVNRISDSVSIVDLTTLNVVATLDTLDEPGDVVFALTGAAEKAFVSCATFNAVQVFQTSNLAAPPARIDILGERPTALAVDATGTKVYVAIFESGNHSTVLGGGGVTNIAFPPNVVTHVSGPYGGTNPPPNFGTLFSPPKRAGNPTSPAVGLIVKKNAAQQWMDDNNHNWTALVSDQQAPLSGRLVGWDLYDYDVAVIDAATNAVTGHSTGLMNICMNLAVNPGSGCITVIGTDGTNEVRFEPVVNGKFLRVKFASVDPLALTSTQADLNPHLTYASATIPQAQRDLSLGDPRGIVWSSSGTTGYVSGMGSNNVIEIGATGARAVGVNPIEVGQGPTGLALDAPRSRLYVLNRFDATVSAIDTSSRAVVATVPMHDPTPIAIKTGRKHLYDTHKNSGLGHISCASCHVDSRMDRLAWDLGDPDGVMDPVLASERNLGQNLLGLSPGTASPNFAPYHPMKGPMTTQTLQDIIGKEPHHWRGDRLGIEAFNPAYIGLQGDDANLTIGIGGEMQEFEDFLATLTFPPNPYRNFDNSLPTSLAMPGHYTTGRFAAAGTQYPPANPQAGMAVYRSATMRLDMNAFACVTCHTLPTGAGTDMRMTSPVATPYVAIPPGPNGERHLQLVSVDGVSNITMKTPQLRNNYQKQGFNLTQLRNTAGFGVLHDGSVDSLERFVSEPVFNVTSDQMVADLVAFILCMSGSDLPAGSVTNPFEPPGPLSRDSHAAVGAQTTASTTADLGLVNSMIAQATTGKVALTAKGVLSGKQRGFAYVAGNWQSDRVGEIYSTPQLLALASPGSEITLTVVPTGSQTRIGIDRDQDGFLDRNELDVCSDPASAASRPGTIRSVDVNGDLAVGVQDIFDFLVAWFAGAADFNADSSTSVQDIFDFLAAWFACGAI